MQNISWPAAVVMSVFVCATAALAWKGVVPGHIFLVMGGAILGYAVPRQGGAAPLLALGSRAKARPIPPSPASPSAPTPRDQGK